MKERIKNHSILQIVHHEAYGLVMLYNILSTKSRGYWDIKKSKNQNPYLWHK